MMCLGYGQLIIVIAPVSTGKDSKRKIIVNKIDQINNEIRSSSIPVERILMMVEIKLIAPIIEDAPARWRKKIARSTDGPLWVILLANGGGLTALGRHFGIARSVCLSVPRRSCLGYRHAGCLQLSHRRPPEMCGLRTRPRTDVDPPRFLDRSAIGGRHIVSPSRRYLAVQR